MQPGSLFLPPKLERPLLVRRTDSDRMKHAMEENNMSSEENPTTALHIIVHGHVQGVGFRYFVQKRALALNLTGWVRNRPEGTVEIWAEGPRAALDNLLAYVERGPRPGLVRRLEHNQYSAKRTFRGFDIRW